MGEQQNLRVQVYRTGDEIIVIHDGGHRLTAKLELLDPKGLFAILQFGLSGDRKVQLKPTPKNNVPVGRFYGKGMGPWRIDALTVERLVETAKVDAARKKKELNRARTGKG